MAAVRTRVASSQKPSLGRPGPEESTVPNLAITVARDSFLPARTNNVTRSLSLHSAIGSACFYPAKWYIGRHGQENPDADGRGSGSVRKLVTRRRNRGARN